MDKQFREMLKGAERIRKECVKTGDIRPHAAHMVAMIEYGMSQGLFTGDVAAGTASEEQIAHSAEMCACALEVIYSEKLGSLEHATRAEKLAIIERSRERAEAKIAFVARHSDLETFQLEASRLLAFRNLIGQLELPDMLGRARFEDHMNRALYQAMNCVSGLGNPEDAALHLFEARSIAERYEHRSEMLSGLRAVIRECRGGDFLRGDCLLAALVAGIDPESIGTTKSELYGYVREGWVAILEKNLASYRSGNREARRAFVKLWQSALAYHKQEPKLSYSRSELIVKLGMTNEEIRALTPEVN